MGTEGHFMNLHEYQSKQVFARYAIPARKADVAGSPGEAVAAARKLGGSPWVVKVRVHRSGRGRTGAKKPVKPAFKAANSVAAKAGRP
jgi:succinyl-CoA synthetase beta subunit